MRRNWVFLGVLAVCAVALGVGVSGGFDGASRADLGFGESAVTHTTWLQVGAHSPGAHGSRWRTDLGLRNVADQAAMVEVRFYPQDGAEMQHMTTVVDAGEQGVLVDVVGQIGAGGSGAIAVLADQLLIVTSRTYNLIADDAECTPGGTFGQYYDGYLVSEGLAEGDSAWLTHLAESSRFRTNLAFTNMGDANADVQVELFDGAGLLLETFSIELAPAQYHQEFRVFRNRADQSALQRGSARVTVTEGAGILASASVVDNTTNDPTTVPMIVYPSPADASVWLQVAAHSPGAHGSQWRTDLGLRNVSDEQAVVEVRFYPAAGGDAVSDTVQVAAGAQSVLADVVGQLGASGTGAMEIIPSQPVVVTSRTYNLIADDAECTPGGTFGQYYAGYGVAHGLAEGDSAWLAHLSESGRFRSNLAFTNMGDEDAALQVELFHGAGVVVAEFDLELAPGEYVQEFRVFRNRADLSNVPQGSARVTVAEGAGIIASASVVDNITNDPTTIPGLMPVWDCTYSIAPTSRDHGPEGGEGTVTVTTFEGCPWTAVSNVDWIAVAGAEAAGIGSGTVEYTVEENPEEEPRTGTMTIAGHVFTVTQAAAGCEYAIDPTSREHGPEAMFENVSVTAPDGCEWTAVSNVDWISVTAGAAGSGNGTIEYLVEENPVEEPRTGTLTIAGHTFTVTQAAAAPAVTAIFGQVTQAGAPAAGVEIQLMFDDGGGTFNLLTSTMVNGGGSYEFLDVAPLGAGERYLVRFRQDTGANPQDDAWLRTWVSFPISELAPGQVVPGGTFDIAAIANREPSPGSNRLLPVEFTWTPRPATNTDDYSFRILDIDTGDPDLFTDPLGYVGSYTISSLPPGFVYGQRYFWTLYIDGPDGGWGQDTWFWSITFQDPAMDPPPPGITHSVAGNITAGNSVACTVQGADPQQTEQNQYLRAFTLADFGISGAFEVHTVHFGIESLTKFDSSSTTLTVNLYEKGASMDYADLTLLGTGTGDFDPQTLTVVSVPVSGTAPAGSTLVVEVVTPSLEGAGSIWVGSNPLGQTGPTYLASSACGIDEPTDLSDVGPWPMHFVLSAEGAAESAPEATGSTNLQIISIGDPLTGSDSNPPVRPAKAGHELATQLSRTDGAHLIAPSLNRR